MPPEIVNILIQLPIVLVFIWYFDRSTTRFENFLREEREARIAQLKSLDSKLDEIGDSLTEHRSDFKVAVAKMEVTAARNAVAPTAERKTTPRGAAKP